MEEFTKEQAAEIINTAVTEFKGAFTPEVKSQIEELEVQRDEVTRRLSEVQVELNRKKENLNNVQ